MVLKSAMAWVQGGTITGTIIFSDDATPSATHQFSAKLVPVRRPRSPQRHEFTPTAFYRQFSALNKPVLNVWPGDTIHTTTLDAGGTDEHGITRVLGEIRETWPLLHRKLRCRETPWSCT